MIGNLKAIVGNQLHPRRIKLSASPAKRQLLNLARRYSPDIALLELIDNAVDIRSSEGQDRDLHVKVAFDFEDSICSRITISDNGGGVPVERLEALVQPGPEYPNEQAIGVWGLGLKVACIVLGKKAVIKTRFREGPTYQIELTDPWWHSDTWELWAEPVPPEEELAPGSFQVILDDLKQPLHRDDLYGRSRPESIMDRISRIYAPLLSEDRSPRIYMDYEDTTTGKVTLVKPSKFGDPGRFADLFAYPPGFPPTMHTFWIDRKHDLKVDVVVGLLPQQSRDQSGVTMYGNGRLFAQALKEGSVGFGTRGPALIPASHPTIWRLVVLMYFDGPNDLIPWRTGTKDGYADNNPYFEEIRTIISDLAAPYAVFTRAAKSLDILPFSKSWNQSTDEEIEKEIIQFTGDSKVAKQIRQSNDHLRAVFISLRVEKIDEAGRRSPPFRLPCLNIEASKSIARRLTQRDLQHKSAPWGEHWLQQLWEEEENPEGPEGVESESAIQEIDSFPHLRKAKERPDEWRKTKRVTVSLPASVADMIQASVSSTMSDWLQRAVLKRVGEEIEPILLIPPESSEFWPILEGIRESITESLSGIKAIGIYGSVAAGTTDRASDIDVMVVHDDRLLAQKRVNDLFETFRYPPGVGERYIVNCTVMSEKEIKHLRNSAKRESRELLEQCVWIYPPQGYKAEVDESE